MHPVGYRSKGISTIAFNSHIHIVAFNRECIALGHKPQALGTDRELCVRVEERGDKGFEQVQSNKIYVCVCLSACIFIGVKSAECIWTHIYVKVCLCVCASLWCWRRCCHWRQSGHHSDPEWNKEVSPEYQSDFPWDVKRPIAAIRLTSSLSSAP